MLVIATSEQQTQLYILFPEIFFPKEKKSTYAVNPKLYKFKYNKKYAGVYNALPALESEFNVSQQEDQFIPFVERSDKNCDIVGFYFGHRQYRVCEWKLLNDKDVDAEVKARFMVFVRHADGLLKDTSLYYTYFGTRSRSGNVRESLVPSTKESPLIRERKRSKNSAVIDLVDRHHVPLKMNEGRNSKRGGERCSTDDASGTEEVERENGEAGCGNLENTIINLDVAGFDGGKGGEIHFPIVPQSVYTLYIKRLFAQGYETHECGPGEQRSTEIHSVQQSTTDTDESDDETGEDVIEIEQFLSIPKALRAAAGSTQKSAVVLVSSDQRRERNVKFFINLRVGMRVRVQCMTGYTKGVVIDFSRDCVHAITGNSSLVSVVKLTGEHGLMVESDKQPRPLPSSKYILIRRDQRLAIKLIAAKNEELAASQ